MHKEAGLLTIIVFLLSSCAVAPTPQNAQEYRTVAKEGVYGSNIDSYIVNRPYSKVTGIIKAKTKQCLNKKVAETHCIYTGTTKSCQTTTIIYTPTLRRSSRKTELHMHRRTEPNSDIYLGGKPPATGMYISVFDFEPAGKNKTRITVYSPEKFFQTIPKAVKRWTKGTSMSCPVFAQGS